MQQVDSRSGGRRTQASSTLPQFELQAADVVDADRTLEQLPALSSDRLPPLSSDRLPEAPPSSDVVTAPAVYASAHELDADMAKTVELVPEISANDILAEVVARRAARPPLVLPPPTSAPIDLGRLLARARAEASRSPDFFHPAAPPGPPPSSASPFDLVSEPTPFALSIRTTSARLADELEPELPVAARRRTRRFAWMLGVMCAVAAVSLGIALGQARTSAAHIGAPVAVAPVKVAAAAKASAKVRAAEAPVSAAQNLSVAATSLPRVEAGTISLAAVAASHRLFVDGRVAEGGTSVVSCGRHLVQVGSRGARHTVNVPCGEEVVLDH